MQRLLQTLLISGALLSAPALLAQEMPASRSARMDTLSLSTEQGLGQQFLVAQSDGLTLSQAVEQVRRQYKGRIVSAETKRSGNREVHHIKVLTEDGKVRTVKVSGRKLGNKG